MEGDFVGINADVFEHGSVQATVSADSAHVSRAENQLTLSNSVRITSKSYKSVLDCKHATYDANGKRYHAYGSVVLVTEMGTLGPLRELWANSDLTRVSSSKDGLL